MRRLLAVLAVIALVAASRPPVHVIPSGASPVPVAEASHTETDLGLATGAPSGTAAFPSKPAPSVTASPEPAPTAVTIPPVTAVNPHPPRDTGLWQATWYDNGPGLYAAIRPDLGRKGEHVRVCQGSRCVVLPIVDVCACLGRGSDRAVDLSPAAFRYFAALSAGVLRVTVEVYDVVP